MNDDLSRKTPRGSRRFHAFEKLMAAGVVVSIAAGWWGYTRYHQRDLGPEQPIPFSHRLHVHNKKLGCLLCHGTAAWTNRAGIPPLQTCMLCHERIAIHYPPIAKLRSHYHGNQPVAWVRVAWVSEFAYFPHLMHLQAGIDCGSCHGNIAMMDRVVPVRKFEMGFCIGCHRKNGATIDCFACHR